MITSCIKVIIVGDPGVGKTSFIERLCTGQFTERRTQATPSMDTTIPIPFSMNISCYNRVVFELYDNHYASKVDTAIIFFDLLNYESFSKLESYYAQVLNMYPAISVVIVGNKCDRREAVMEGGLLQFGSSIRTWIDSKRNEGASISFYPISVKSQANFHKPLLYLARKVLGPQ